MGQLTNTLNGNWNNGGDNVQVIGIEGFTALIRESEVENYSSEVAENPLESGAKASDHIITEPMTISISGTVANEHVEGIENFGMIGNFIGSTSVVTQYLPPSSQAQATKAKTQIDKGYNTLNKADALIDDGMTIASLLGFETAGGNVEQFRTLMIERWSTKTPIKIQFAGSSFQDMAILNLSFQYDNILDNMGFSLELRKLNITDLDSGKPATELGGALDDCKNLGNEQPRKGGLKCFN